MQKPANNWEDWQLLCRDLPAPQSFIDWNFYFLVGAALQRRIWMGDESFQPLYPNIYVTLVGPPSCGKGISISPTNDALRFHKMPNKNARDLKESMAAGSVSPEEMENIAQAEAIIMGDEELKNLYDKRLKNRKERLLIPMGANSTTFESLTQTIASNPRYINYLKPEAKVASIYSHCSLAIVLTELSSLFKKRNEHIVTLITDLYDCKPYHYKTKHQGEDVINRGCINMIAGTTFSYMEEVFSDHILNDGYASRTFFIVESKPRFFKWNFTILTPEQLEARQRLLNYIKSLTTIYGECRFTPGAEEYLRVWWEDEHDKVIVNHDPRLEYYYGRKNIHIKKMAMILHFTESRFLNGQEGLCNMEIALDTVTRAMSVLGAAEKTMHQALCFTSSNPVARASRKLLQMLAHKGEMTWQDIQVEFIDKVNSLQDLRDMITYLEGVEKIEGEENPIPELRRKGLVYKLKKGDKNE